MKNNISNLWHRVVMAYMLLALMWWSLLLLKKNNENYALQLQLNPEKKELIKKKHKRQKIMILGESLFFGIALAAGIWLINRAYRNEVLASEKQSNFLLSVTHELKSPLASIKLILQTLMKHSLDKEKRNDLSHNALLETSRLESMVNNILLATKIDHSYEYNFEIIKPSDLILERLILFNSKFPEREFNISQMDDFESSLDKEAFISIITNLIENAHKYSPIDYPVDISLIDRGENYIFKVKDNGPGISVSEQSRIFEKFHRISDIEYNLNKGSGLGLYVVKRLVEDLKGSISLEENKPDGTIISVQLKKNPV